MMKMRVRFATRNKNNLKNLMKNNTDNKKYGKSGLANIKNHIETHGNYEPKKVPTNNKNKYKNDDDNKSK